MSHATINWHNLKPFNDSRDGGFEELCKQLFGSECRNAGASWIPKGRIDAGVEGFGRFPNGDEWALQAKWFLESPGPKQWRQLDDSVKTALDRHPNLKRYVTYMPLDLSDAREPKTKTALGRWGEAKARYEQVARDCGMDVTFELRTSHDIVRELVKPKNRGLRHYFFGGADLSPERIRRNIEDRLADAGERYSRKLNIDVPLVRYADAMTLSGRFVKRVFEHYRAVSVRMSVLDTDVVALRFPKQAVTLAEECRTILDNLLPLSASNDASIAWPDVAKRCRDLTDKATALARVVRDIGDTSAAEASESQPDTERRNPYQQQVHDLWRLASALDDLGDFADSSEVQLSRSPYMLLVGEAGSGKTHFLCDVGLNTVDAGNVAIIVFGAEKFDGNTVWGEIARKNSVPSDHDELLGALQSAAEATDTRALILIDAINEGPSSKFWYDNLNTVVHQVKRYSRVALVVSVRDTYERLCLRDDAKQHFVRVTHEGFAYHPLEAERAFFEYFKIAEPPEPLLLNEFRNPLFLLLFCRGIKAAGLSEIPRGLSGLTAIFDFFLHAQNKRISEDDLDADPEDRLVQKALAALADALTGEMSNAIERARAKTIIDALHPPTGYSTSLFAALERRGLIARVDTGETTYVRFTYERMADHQRARRLLESLPAGPDGNQTLRLRLAEIAQEPFAALRSSGMLEALSIQLPERRGVELVALVPKVLFSDAEMLLRTLPWRQPESVTDTTRDNVFDWLTGEAQLRDEVVECLLSCAIIPNHPLGADALHAYLRSLTLPKRDAIWTVLISGRQHEGAAVMRLTSWARDGAFGARRTGTVIAAGTALLWLCSSSNRRVRDDATKGLVTLLDAVPSASIALLERFHDCNDPYIVQRMYAALSGYAMRTYSVSTTLGDLARAVLRVARDPGLPVDILARDFARTIVERAIFVGAIDAGADVRVVRPPYGAAPPDLLDADYELFDRYLWKNRPKGSKDFPRGLISVHGSLDNMGDFSRYVVGTNGRGDWLSVPITEPPPLTRQQHRDAFDTSLTKKQHRLRDAMFDAGRVSGDIMRDLVALATDQRANNAKTYQNRIDDLSVKFMSTEEGARALDAESKAKDAFVASLSEGQRAQFLTANTREHEDLHYDMKAATRWIFRRVLDLGYGGDGVHEFDQRVWRDTPRERDDGRREHIERIGKKYQWIAFFEFLARMADNFYVQRWSDEAVPYEVPLQVITPDIDPSSLLIETRRPQYDPHAQSWWAGAPYADWRTDLDIDGWMRETANLPDPTSALVVVDPHGVEWICLNTHLSWREREPLLQERYAVPRRELWYLVFGFLAPKTEASRVYNALRKRASDARAHRPMPEDVYRLLWGDLYWSRAFLHESSALSASRNILDAAAKKVAPQLIEPATAAYLRETGNDNSIADAIRVAVPIKEIVEGVGGVASDPERGAWLDMSGAIVAFDPSVREPGPQSVLVRRDRLEAFLHASPYAVVWTLLSEKQVIGGWSDHNYGRLVTSGAYWLKEGPLGSFRIVGGKTPTFER